MLEEIQKRLKALADPERAAVSQRFFKTGPGEYGEGDQFIGIRVPVLRKLARRFKALPVEDTQILLKFPVHEARLLALFILIIHYKRGKQDLKKQIYRFYLDSTAFINNWDLVDASAEHIVGDFLQNRSKSILFRLARSRDLWERRIAIISTFCYIKQNIFDDALKISEMLLTDREDLIHKAVGWMLREIGKRDLSVEEEFLKRHYQKMPRVMLRYAIEKFPEPIRQRYLKGRI